MKESCKYFGIVYDVGLQFTPGNFSVTDFNLDLVKYDMSVISKILHANAVRIEGEDINRLVETSKIAHDYEMKVFFNPWIMNVGEKETVAYMIEAAKAAEELRLQGFDLIFVAGCEYSLFNNGIFEGTSIMERLDSFISLAKEKSELIKTDILQKKNEKLNKILSNISNAVRLNFKGDVTYSSGTWETVDWNFFDIVGVDYYRYTQTDEEYINGVKNYLKYNKPVIVMEVGCCTYIGAAKRGGGGFTILKGNNPDGTGIYEGGKPPVRSEKEQADYIQSQINLLKKSDVDGVFIFEFSMPATPYREQGFDADLTSFAVVKTYPNDDLRSQNLPPWEPKEAFYVIADEYRK